MRRAVTAISKLRLMYAISHSRPSKYVPCFINATHKKTSVSGSKKNWRGHLLLFFLSPLCSQHQATREQIGERRFKLQRCCTDNRELRRIPTDIWTRGSITDVGLISGFIIFVQTWSQERFKTCRCSHGPAGSQVFSPYLFIYLFAGLDFWGQWSTKLLCKYILFTAWQICCLHRNWSSYSGIKAITRQ